MFKCSKAGCGATSTDPAGDGWHLPTEKDTRNGHNVNALLFCPRCWQSCLRMGFTL